MFLEGLQYLIRKPFSEPAVHSELRGYATHYQYNLQQISRVSPDLKHRNSGFKNHHSFSSETLFRVFCFCFPHFNHTATADITPKQSAPTMTRKWPRTKMFRVSSRALMNLEHSTDAHDTNSHTIVLHLF